jgi:hypothetical protein
MPRDDHPTITTDLVRHLEQRIKVTIPNMEIRLMSADVYGNKFVDLAFFAVPLTFNGLYPAADYLIA